MAAKSGGKKAKRVGFGKKRVAIIGGGLGGLTAAAFLQGMEGPGGKGPTFECEIFEASGRLGGNMCSAYFGQPHEEPFADLAVNDFNATTYVNLVRMLRTLKAFGLDVPTGELVDKDCFFQSPVDGYDDAVTFTSDEVADAKSGVLLTLRENWARFRQMAAEVMSDDRWARATVDEFVDANGFAPEFRDLMLLPRINAMYFMPEGAPPGDMPIRGVMFYYHLQEGLGAAGGPTLRLSFRKGASQWAHQLETFVRGRGTKVHLRTGRTTVKGKDGTHVVFWNQDGKTIADTFDAVVCAVPPFVVPEVFPALSPQMREGMARYGRYPGYALVHRDPRVMPAERAKWMTYNVVINPPGRARPYTMSYVNAMHNGVPVQDPPFVTENPLAPIADDDVYDMVDLANPEGPRVKARAEFMHNTVSLETMDFQDTFWKTLQGRDGVWFTGGWTNGAGLQEQILVSSACVAMGVRGFPEWRDFMPVFSKSAKAYMPHYLRRTIRGAEAEDYPAGFWPEAPKRRR